MRKVKKLLMSVVIIIAGVYLVICVAAFLMQRQLIYHPFRQILATPTDVGLAYRELKLQSPDGGDFIVWEMPAESAQVSVIYFHGNAENISNAVDTYKLLHGLGVSVYAFEYRGYAGCAGAPSEKAIENDVNIFADYLRDVLPDDVKVVAMGRSLGGAVAAKLAVVYPVAGLILESTFNRMSDVARRAFPYLPVSLLLRERYDTESVVRTFDKPLLVVHGPDDEVVPFDLGKRLYDAAAGEKTFVELTGSHNAGFSECEDKLRAAYRAFFDQLK